MRNRAQEEASTSIRQIFSDETANSESGVLLDFAREESRLFKARRTVNPRLPQTISEFSGMLQASPYSQVRGQQFYRCLVESDNGHQACIFVYEKLMQSFQDSQQIYFDGTFKTTPALFYQNFVVFFKHMGHVFPGAFILMSNKSQELYTASFQYLRQIGISPEIIMSDWERASRNSASQTWPDAIIKGCFYHFTSAVQKKLRKMRLSTAFTNNEAKNTLQKVLCLPLLPADKIRSTFYQVKSQNTSAMLAPWLRYVERIWISGTASSELSVFEVIDRTNNYSESTFATFNASLHPHPNVFVLIEFLAKRTYRDALDIERLSRSLTIRRPRPQSSVQKERRIKNANRLMSQDRITPLEMISSLRDIPNMIEVPDQSDSDGTSDNDLEDSLSNSPENDNSPPHHQEPDSVSISSLPDIIAVDPNAPETGLETFEDVIPPSWTMQSERLLPILHSSQMSYSPRDQECALGCGDMNGNLVLVPCGHMDYCLNCMIRHCSVNQRFNPRFTIRCPECNATIESFVTTIIRP